MATGKTATLKEFRETLAFIVERMATKEDLKQFATKDEVREIVRAIIQEEVPGIVAVELKPVRNDLKQIEERLDALEQHHANLKGLQRRSTRSAERCARSKNIWASKGRLSPDHPRARGSDFVQFTHSAESG